MDWSEGSDKESNANLVLELDMEEAIASEVERYVDGVKASFRKEGVKLKRATVAGRRGEATIELRDPNDQEDAEKIISISSTRSNLPEPLRVANVIALGLSKQVFQEKKGNS